MPLRPCLKRTPSSSLPGTPATTPSTPGTPVREPSSSSVSLSWSSSSASLTPSTRSSRTVRFSAGQSPVFTTHSSSEYDRRPAEVARCGLARLLGAGAEDGMPPPGSCAGDAWAKAQTAAANERELAAATSHSDVHDSVDAAWALGAARLMGLSADDGGEDGPAPTASTPLASVTEDVDVSVSSASDAADVHPSDAVDSASCVSDSSCDTESDEEATQVVSVFNLRGEETALEVPRYRGKSLEVPASTTEKNTLPRTTGPRARAPPHPEAESGRGGWDCPYPAMRTLSPPAVLAHPRPSSGWDRERAMLGMSPHHQARLDRRTHAQRVCLMARFGLLDQPRKPLPGPDPHAHPAAPGVSAPAPAVSAVLGSTQPIYKR